MSDAFGKMWIILEPILFALIGSEVQVKIQGFQVGLNAGFQCRWTRSTLSQPAVVCLFSSQVRLGFLFQDQKVVLFTALLFRMIGVVFAVSGGNLNKKEKIFMAFAWLPKAAVQVMGLEKNMD